MAFAYPSWVSDTAQGVGELQMEMASCCVYAGEKKDALLALLEKQELQKKEASKVVDMENQIKIDLIAFSAASAEIDAIAAELQKEMSAYANDLEAINAARDALDSKALATLAAEATVHPVIEKTCAALLVMLHHEFEDRSWERSKKMMKDVDKFLQALHDFDAKETFPETVEDFLRKQDLGEDPEFDVLTSAPLSFFAARNESVERAECVGNLASWVRGVYKYNRNASKLKPLMLILDAKRADHLHEQVKLEALKAETQEKLNTTSMQPLQQKCRRTRPRRRDWGL